MVTPEQSLFGGVERIVLPDAKLFYWSNFIASLEADDIFRQLENAIGWRQDTITIAGKTILIPRLNAWYGDSGAVYAYSGIRFNALPWLPVLRDLRKRITDQLTQEVGLAASFNSVLANWYRNGEDSVVWHADDEPELGRNPLIASLSLGASRRFMLKHMQSKQTFEITLPSGSLLVMAGTTQHHWQHQVPKEKSVTAGRINLTFRTVV